MEQTNDDPLKIKMTSVSFADGSVSYHVVMEIDGGRVVFDGADKARVVAQAIEYLHQLAEVGTTRLRSLLR